MPNGTDLGVKITPPVAAEELSEACSSKGKTWGDVYESLVQRVQREKVGLSGIESSRQNGVAKS